MSNLYFKRVSYCKKSNLFKLLFEPDGFVDYSGVITPPDSFRKKPLILFTLLEFLDFIMELQNELRNIEDFGFQEEDFHG